MSSILIGPGYLTWNSGTFRAASDIVAEFKKDLRDIESLEFGKIDSVQTARMIVVKCRLFSTWTNLSLLFPSAALSPAIGTALYGASNLALIVNGADGSKLTVVNAQVTKLANLFLGVSKDIFPADVEFTGLLLNGGSPGTSGDYYTYQVGQSYSAPAFPNTSFTAPVISAAWAGTLVNSGTSFAAFYFKEGATIDWEYELDFKPCTVDGFGATDAIIKNFRATCKGIPTFGPLEADTASALFPAQALGLSENQNGAGDLTLTWSGHSVVLHKAFVKASDGFKWSTTNNRLGNLTWQTTVPFSTGVAQARVTVS
ncbi:MAG TPA: hypothetical protein VGY56_10710 [Verrucomicrobiae bacterium]|nr:hypothetical protein [Verrucomicrobiae bacterium]